MVELICPHCEFNFGRYVWKGEQTLEQALVKCNANHTNASKCIYCPDCGHTIEDGVSKVIYYEKHNAIPVPNPPIVCEMCHQEVGDEYKAGYLENHLLDFEEHFQMCDTCTLTWSDDWCDDFYQFLSYVGTNPVVQLEQIHNGRYVKIEINGIHLGVAQKDFEVNGQIYKTKKLPLLLKNGAEFVWVGDVVWTPEKD